MAGEGLSVKKAPHRPGTATTGNHDYIAKSRTLSYVPGETTKTITITVKSDRKREASETFYLDLFGLRRNASFTKNRGIGTILNDDCGKKRHPFCDQLKCGVAD